MIRTSIFPGGGVRIKKADGAWEVAGYLVRFRQGDDDKTVDLYGDYFTRNTDLGVATSSPILFEHGMDSKFGPAILGKVDHEITDVGVWIQGYLDQREEYEQYIEKLAQNSKKLGWSSGTASHLVRIKSTETGNEILSWPLGLDASLTFTPAEPRNTLEKIKMLEIHSVGSTETDADGNSRTVFAVDGLLQSLRNLNDYLAK